MKSIILIAKELLVPIERPFYYILTYTFLQYHIALLFVSLEGEEAVIAPQIIFIFIPFKYVMRHLLLKNSIVASRKANVISLNEYCTCSLFSLKWAKHRSPVQDHLQDDEVSDEETKALSENLDTIALSDFTENVNYYSTRAIALNGMKNLGSKALTLICTADEHDYVPAPFSRFS